MKNISISLDISLENIRRNLSVVEKRTKTNVFVVVKANAYGMGLATIALAVASKASGFAVATKQEAKKLALLNLFKPIIILGGGVENQPSYSDKYFCENNNIIPTVCSIKDLLATKSAKINIKINTGMNRTGVFATEFPLFYQNAKREHEVFSVFSHLSDTSDEKFTAYQKTAFVDATACVDKSVKKHLSASNCLGLPSDYYFDFTRCGLCVYGYGDKNVSPCLKAETNIMQIFSAKKDSHVGYGSTKLTSDTKIAAIQAGYADGFRRLSKDRFVSVNGARCQVLAVCMDISLVDVTNIQVSESDKVYIVDEVCPLIDLAESYGTNEYEVLTSFNNGGERCARRYH